MKLIGAAIAAAVLYGSAVQAQEITTVTKEKTKFEVKDGKDITVSGCLDRFEDAGYFLTNDVGDLKYVLVTNDNLSKYVGRRVEVKGQSTVDGHGKLKIEKEVGTSGEIGGQKTDDTKTKRTTEFKGDVGFPYVSVRSLKKISNRCQ